MDKAKVTYIYYLFIIYLLNIQAKVTIANTRREAEVGGGERTQNKPRR